MLVLLLHSELLHLFHMFFTKRLILGVKNNIFANQC